MTNTFEEQSQQPKKGALPFEVNHGFVQVPNAIMRHYQYYPKFNGATTVVYGFILSQFNDAFGYAFPTHIQVAQAVNMTEKTARNHVKLLREVGLIEVTENGRFGNHTYTFNKPIEIADEFFAKYPEAGERWRILNAALTKEKADKGDRKTKLTAEIDEDITDWL